MPFLTPSRRRLTALVLAAATTVGAAACSSSASAGSGATTRPIYFGVSSATTGQYAQYGQQFTEGFDLAVEQVNANGGSTAARWPSSTRTPNPTPSSLSPWRRSSSPTRT
ncbi:hypothetical protein [Raineyella fluvialis]|uniref:hypothetical protein n=1 Tax=Raineyella fluvialis TaxID=2662261 RepID=UPI0018900C55|nr:hypothetical protein [Raineyella fluvialis]